MDNEKLKEIDSEYIEIRTHKQAIIDEYTKELDGLMGEIKEAIVEEQDYSSLVRYSIELPAKMYELSSRIEDLGLKVDIADIIRGEKRNMVLINANGTIPEKQARAELYSTHYAYAKELYERCYYSIKGKIDNANQMLISIRALLQSLEKEKNFG